MSHIFGANIMNMYIMHICTFAFCDLEHIEEIENFCRIKVLDLDDVASKSNSSPEPSTNIISHIEMSILNKNNLRKKPWRNGLDFEISKDSFSVISRNELQKAETEYNSSLKLHKASHKLKREILDILSKELSDYSLYPTDEMYANVTKKLIKNFPSLQDPIVGDGISCWKIALKYRMQEIRRKCKCNETSINSGKRSRSITLQLDLNANKSPLQNGGIKKARRGEVNYAPDFPDGENESTLQQHQEQMNREWMKKDFNRIFINQKMEVTFSFRRQQIISRIKMSEIKEQWPALFTPDQDELNPQMNVSEAATEPLPPHPVLIEMAGRWAISCEGDLLMQNLEFIDAVINLIMTYYACDMEYHECGVKSMLFLQVGLAEISSSVKIPPVVRKIITEMKLNK
ncbi:uncharacterized protein LOC118196249 isoform X2 [Stegodyphus dumicola]|uniref:uncharacterized protein LOC118196249 isoform X2 n=1 Tax=Stegodyphus dumicola TaxID=202533 RepID=UPI0015AA4217|nr:uncharacterized protein LOC118196249 isoform X2 [Stegodyphus dumicola]